MSKRDHTNGGEPNGVAAGTPKVRPKDQLTGMPAEPSSEPATPSPGLEPVIVHGQPAGRPAEVEADVGNKGEPETAPRGGQPWLALEIAGVRALAHAAAPTLVFSVDVTDRSERAAVEIFTAALTVQIQIEPTKRVYDPATKALLVELFGEPHRWATTGSRLLWTTESFLVPSFTGKTSLEITVMCNYDLELSATKYFYSVPDGVIPLTFQFNGSVYYSGDEGRLQIIQLPWDTISDFKMPLSVWKGMISSYYPYRGWVPLHSDTRSALERHKIERGLPTMDDTILELLAKAKAEGVEAEASADASGQAPAKAPQEPASDFVAEDDPLPGEPPIREAPPKHGPPGAAVAAEASRNPKKR